MSSLKHLYLHVVNVVAQKEGQPGLVGYDAGLVFFGSSEGIQQTDGDTWNATRTHGGGWLAKSSSHSFVGVPVSLPEASRSLIEPLLAE